MWFLSPGSELISTTSSSRSLMIFPQLVFVCCLSSYWKSWWLTVVCRELVNLMADFIWFTTSVFLFFPINIHKGSLSFTLRIRQMLLSEATYTAFEVYSKFSPQNKLQSGPDFTPVVRSKRTILPTLVAAHNRSRVSKEPLIMIETISHSFYKNLSHRRDVSMPHNSNLSCSPNWIHIY